MTSKFGSFIGVNGLERTILMVGDPATDVPEVCVELETLAPKWKWMPFWASESA